jgi:hypothetical protein
MKALRGGWSRFALALAVLIAAAALSGCGESGEDGAEQLAKQQELRAAREDAARDARQAVKIAELERRLNGAKRRDAQPPPAPAEAPVAVAEEGPAPAGGSLAGLWKGEAVIRYDSGESDPFNQTIEIDSLTPGAVSGYSEARQGSTTCHGPITYEGSSEGWYRFRAVERNSAECIDYSVVELMPDGAGNLAYRETTDVSISSGTLEPVG